VGRRELPSWLAFQSKEDTLHQPWLSCSDSKKCETKISQGHFLISKYHSCIAVFEVVHFQYMNAALTYARGLDPS
jgi:hypothetical protein